MHCACCRGALHTGQYMTTMLSGLRMSVSAARSARAGKAAVLQATMGGTSGGGLLSLAPVNEDMPVQTLLALQAALIRGQSHAAGLNPRAFR